MRPVTIQFNQLSDRFCPSNPTDLIQELNRLVKAYANDNGERVRIEFGFPKPPFCPENAEQFIEGLNGVSRGYVESSGAAVHVEFGVPPGFCWTDPWTIVAQLEAYSTAYVE